VCRTKPHSEVIVEVILETAHGLEEAVREFDALVEGSNPHPLVAARGARFFIDVPERRRSRR